MKPHEQLERLAEEYLCPGMYPVSCSSGTAALHLACEVLEAESECQGWSLPGCILPDFAMIACARAVSLTVMEPRFVDVTANGLMDPREVEEEVSSGRDVGVMAVHTYGRLCDMGEINRIAEENKLFVIEDMAECHGRNPHVNTHAACWSFYKNKIVAGEEGGLVAFRDKGHADHARKLRCLGFTEAHDFNHVPRGHNYRLADCLAERVVDNGSNRWGCLQELWGNLRRRREVEQWYDEVCPSEWRMPKRDVPWVYDLRVLGMTYEQQDGVVKGLRDQGVEARHGFKPLSKQEEYIKMSTPGFMAGILSREIIYLPVHPTITKEQCKTNMSKLLTLEKLIRG